MPFSNVTLRDGVFVVSSGLQAAARRELGRLRGVGCRFGQDLPSLRRVFRPKFASRSGYYRHCRVALRRALSPYWRGSAAGLKARIREVLHPRRRDVRFLGGVLRATAAPAALAVFMLAANAAPAQAENVCYFTFSQYVGASNPFDQINIGNFSAPAFADLDGDGDSDVVVGGQGGTFDYYRNTGSKTAPVFAKQGSDTNPFNGIDVGYGSVIALGDLDADGDLDALTGSTEGTIRYFRNTGNRVTPVFTERTGTDNPFNGISLGGTSSPALADLDGDGDLDVVAGEYDGYFNYFRNNGNAMFPSFSGQTGGANPLDGFDVGKYSRPAFIDMDRDGDLDLFSGTDTGDVRYFENTGTALAPVFVEPTPFDNPMFGFDAGDYSKPAFGDLDGDGDLDVLIGGSGLSVICAQNVNAVPLPVFEEKQGSENPFSGVAAGVGNNGGAPVLGDLDADGDLDALIGDLDGTIRYYKNIGTKLAPVFSKQGGAANPLNGFFVPIGSSSPKLVDLDGDGDLDLFVGMAIGQFYYLENTGTAMAATFERQLGAGVPLDGVDVGDASALAVADVDGDGDFDVLAGNAQGTFLYLQNYGSSVSPQLFGVASSLLEPIAGQLETSPEFIDIDHDGDLDAVVGYQDGTLKLFLNAGDANTPLFDAAPNEASPLFRVDVAGSASPAFGDLDGDGDLDAVVGMQDGSISYFEQTGDCAPLTVACKGEITLPLGENGALTIDPSDLDGGSSINTVLSVSPETLYCADLGASIPVTLTVTNLVGQYGTCQVNVTVEDASGPVLNLNGSAEVNVACGAVYTELGASVYDGCDANVEVVIGGDTVNTDNAGTYVVTYSSVDGSGNTSQVSRTVNVQGNCTSEDGVQSADQNADFVISLSELLRVIQFYNSLGYHCAASPGDTEDGFEPGAGANKACAPYDTDYNPQDWVISLTELLRVIQFYNSLGYHYCPLDGTEDGFCPGSA